jgi:hypothetical protein
MYCERCSGSKETEFTLAEFYVIWESYRSHFNPDGYRTRIYYYCQTHYDFIKQITIGIFDKGRIDHKLEERTSK